MTRAASVSTNIQITNNMNVTNKSSTATVNSNISTNSTTSLPNPVTIMSATEPVTISPNLTNTNPSIISKTPVNITSTSFTSMMLPTATITPSISITTTTATTIQGEETTTTTDSITTTKEPTTTTTEEPTTTTTEEPTTTTTEEPTTTTTEEPTTTTTIGCVSNNVVMITFDDLQSPAYITNGYRTLNWINALALEGTYHGTSNGYYTATVSSPNVVLNANGDPMAIQSANGVYFTLQSFSAAAAWNDNLQLTVIGYRSNAVIATNTYTLQVFTRSDLVFTGYSGLDALSFITAGGTQNPSVVGSGTHFAMDNLVLTLYNMENTACFT